MAKISKYPAATVPADADVVPMVQGGATKKVALSILKTFFGGGGPTPTVENDFQVAFGSPLAWAKKTLAETQAILGVVGSGAVPIGLLQGLVVSRKDDDEIYVSGGSVEVGEVLYNSDERFVVSIGREPTGYTDDITSLGGTMTASAMSGSAPGTINADGEYGFWEAYSFGGYPQWLKHDAGVGVTYNIAKYTMTPHYNGNFMFTAWTFEGSNDNTEWTILDTQSVGSYGDVLRTFTPAVSGDFRYHRWNISAGPGDVAVENVELIEAIYTLYASTPYYVYVDPPTSGTELVANNFILSPTEPTFDSAKGGYYHPTNTDQRAIAYFATDGDGHIPTSIFHYPPVPEAISVIAAGISVVNDSPLAASEFIPIPGILATDVVVCTLSVNGGSPLLNIMRAVASASPAGITVTADGTFTTGDAINYVVYRVT
ncbi:MAG: hypothetical protein WCJ37_01060 [Syntrophus sp. (in: bacteria)]